MPKWPSRNARVAVLVCTAALLRGVAFANAQGARPPELKAPEPKVRPAPSLPDTGESLSDRLNRSDGVIAPPRNVDPGVQAPPRDPSAGSTMPVIPPPGSRGGDPHVDPK